MRRASSLVFALAASLLALGCGLGAGKSAHDVRLTVTRDFGAVGVGAASAQHPHGSDTVMRLLERNFKVRTRYGGGFVESIDGLAGAATDRQVDWFYYVNGSEASAGAAAVRVRNGDRIWWDRHDWSVALRVPAVVGSFPAPFGPGSSGPRAATRIACTAPRDPACRIARDRLRAAGVRAGTTTTIAASRSGAAPRILVGPWRALRHDPALTRLNRGPAASGVYVRPAPDGASIALLRGDGSRAGSLGPGGGLVAATRLGDDQPTWAVTGVDAAGTLAAAGALDPGRLRNRYAAAVSAGRVTSVP